MEACIHGIPCRLPTMPHDFNATPAAVAAAGSGADADGADMWLAADGSEYRLYQPLASAAEATSVAVSGPVSLGAPGLGLTWLSGFLLAQATGASLLSVWVLSSLALSFVSLQVLLFSVAREGRRGPITLALVLAPLVLVVVLMTWRPG